MPNAQDDSEWRLPPGLSRSSNRDVELRAGGIIALVAFAGMVLGGLGLGAYLYGEAGRQRREAEALDSTQARTTAFITALTRSHDEHAERRVQFRYVVDGKPYTRKIEVPSRIWQKLQVGADLEIRYLPEKPKVSRAVEWRNRPLPTLVAYLPPFSLFIPGLIMAWMVRMQTQLLSDGRVAQGRVTKIVRGSHGGKYVQYEYRLPNGELRKGRAERCKRNEAGETVCVLYDPDRPRRSALYPLSMVRLAGRND